MAKKKPAKKKATKKKVTKKKVTTKKATGKKVARRKTTSKKRVTRKKAPAKKPIEGELLPNKGGRPTDFKEEYCYQAYKLCLLNATDKQLADFFQVCEQTINNWKHAHPKFLESIRDGKEMADATVAESLFKRATGYSHPEVKVFNGQDGIVTHEVTKHYPPDTAAASLWLRNRQPDKWRDKKEVDTTNKRPLEEYTLEDLRRLRARLEKERQALTSEDMETND